MEPLCSRPKCELSSVWGWPLRGLAKQTTPQVAPTPLEGISLKDLSLIEFGHHDAMFTSGWQSFQIWAMFHMMVLGSYLCIREWPPADIVQSRLSDSPARTLFVSILARAAAGAGGPGHKNLESLLTDLSSNPGTAKTWLALGWGLGCRYVFG